MCFDTIDTLIILPSTLTPKVIAVSGKANHHHHQSFPQPTGLTKYSVEAIKVLVNSTL